MIVSIQAKVILVLYTLHFTTTAKSPKKIGQKLNIGGLYLLNLPLLRMY